MTLYGEPRVWLDQYLLGEPVELNLDHLGIRFPGKIIRAESWSPYLGEPLTDDTFFRIVLVGRRRGSQVPVVDDRRIAACLPAFGLTRRRTRLTQEMATIRETQALYLVQRDADADLIRDSLRRRQENLEDELIGEESVRYSQGAIITWTTQGSSHQPDPAAIFAGVEPSTWFFRLGEWLLAQAYPSLPVQHGALTRPIIAEDAADLHRAILRQPGGHAAVISEIGPALGLSLDSAPEVFEPSVYPGFALLKEWLQQQPAPVDFQRAYRHLAHEIGLTSPLALLSILLFVRFEEPEFEISLSSTENLRLLDGSPLLTSRLTQDLIPLLTWDPRIAHQAGDLGPLTEPGWQDTLQHLSYLSPGLMDPAANETPAAGESILLADLENLSQDLSKAHGLLAQLYQAPGDEHSRALTESLERLAAIVAETSNGYRAVYHRIRRVYSDPRLLADDLAQTRHLVELGAFVDDVLGARRYLEGAGVSVLDAPGLSVERQALQAALSLGDSIRPGGRPWSLLAQEVTNFKREYSAAYRTHHQEVQQALPEYQRNLASARQKVNALNLLDQLRELADPGDRAGLGLSQALDQLGDELSFCQIPVQALELESEPVCGSCQLSLEQSVPVQELSRLITSIDTGLGAKNRLLSNLLVGKIMEGSVDAGLEDFLNIVQASDLSALSETLNEDMLAFIRRVLT